MSVYRCLASVFVISIFIGIALASAGDRDPRYIECKENCHAECDAGEKPPLPLILQATYWTCKENCAYDCMRENVNDRIKNDEEIVQYHGKWPFIRVLGIQELFSSLFSVANFLPHLIFMLYLSPKLPSQYWMRPLWKIYAVFNMNCWIWSTVYHARDFPITEKLDYFCTTLAFVAGLSCAIIRIFHITRVRSMLLVALPFAIFFVYHISYLSFVKFDYGYNMKATIALAQLYNLLWIGWAIAVRRPYAWKQVLMIVLINAAAALEVFDFPPVCCGGVLTLIL